MWGNGTINWAGKGIDIHQARGGKMVCPKCVDDRKNKRDKSLSVDLQKGVFNCHHCGWKGSAMERPKIEQPRKIYAKPSPKPTPPQSKAIEWFKSRGISEATLSKAQVTEGKQWMPQVNAERNCICFNYYRAGELINIKYRDGQKNFRMEKDAELIFYNLDSITAESDSVVIVEGEIDALTLIEAGITFPVLSVPNGASKGNQRLEYLDNCYDSFENLNYIILATDNDTAGLALREELARRLGKDRCMTVQYPDGCKDYNEVLLAHGRKEVLLSLKAAEYYPIEGLEKPMDHFDEAVNIFENGFPSYPAIGMGDLDRLFKLDPSGFTVVTGVPGHGKSTWLNNVLVKLAQNRDWKHALFTPEMKPHHYMTNILVSIFTGKAMQSGMSREEYRRAYEFINDHFTYINSEIVDSTVDGILAKAAEMVMRYGINSITIDPWNYATHEMMPGESETSYINRALRKVKIFKERYGCHVFIVAHPTKIQTDAKGMFKVPTMYDISGSAHWFNMMDNGITVYRNVEKCCTEVHVKKIRWDFMGQTGMAVFQYNRNTRQFIPEHEEPDLLPPNPRAGIVGSYYEGTNPNQDDEKPF